ncbi:NADH-quinone oxidoreductase subunit N [Fulvimarina sp. 2208YS6-2-32]|uniref:NADH-quinone oxidoreductase subunit N n=1 Tax=Fulvimarina uroteuthidis TaxID=3098149 RepID=A0ABU5I659_9HYPH|nr:NADH-quinone oxidoreductase subunit N [Fulvimarina sp. 2208YS6-2-32]MDY8110881.1 NADH-quinone oxidoreductase subunit N [Fulvimarina sp. 2208YS6-2-32]
MMPLADILPEIAVLLTAVIIVLLASFLPRHLQWTNAPVALIGLAIAALLLFSQANGEARATFSGTYALDMASIEGRLLILFATAVTVLLSPRWFESDARHGEYYAMLLFSTLGAMVLAGALDLLLVLIGVLLSSATGYVLAAYHRDWALSVEAGMKYFLVGALANTALVLGATFMMGMLGGPGFSEMAAALAAGEASPLLLVGLGLVTMGMAYKLGAVPAHAWLPDVAEGAPAPSAAFLTVVPKIGAAIALARLVSLFPETDFAIRALVAALAVITMTLGNLAALWQEDMRRMLGWSSVSQAGYLLMAVTVTSLTDNAIPALVAFLFGYATANLTAFAAITHLRGRTDRSDYAGLLKTAPLPAIAIIVAFLSLVGIPPLGGFVGKLELFLATIDGGYVWLAIAALVNTVVSLVYYLRFVTPMVLRAPSESVLQLGSWSCVATTIALISVAAVGILAQFLIGPIGVSAFLPN